MWLGMDECKTIIIIEKIYISIYRKITNRNKNYVYIFKLI